MVASGYHVAQSDNSFFIPPTLFPYLFLFSPLFSKHLPQKWKIWIDKKRFEDVCMCIVAEQKWCTQTGCVLRWTEMCGTPLGSIIYSKGLCDQQLPHEELELYVSMCWGLCLCSYGAQVKLGQVKIYCDSFKHRLSE